MNVPLLWFAQVGSDTGKGEVADINEGGEQTSRMSVFEVTSGLGTPSPQFARPPGPIVGTAQGPPGLASSLVLGLPLS